MNVETAEIKEQSRASGYKEGEKEKSRDGNQEMVPAADKELEEKVAGLESEVQSKTGVITELEDRLARLGYDFDGARAAYAYAVDDYKRLAAAANPLVPIEALSGATIEEVKGSLDRALKLVANVQESLSRQAQSAVIPAGAPVRTSAETSAMSTKEKINYGLEQARTRKEQ